MNARERAGSELGRWSSFDDPGSMPDHVQGIVWWHRGNAYDHRRHRHASLELHLVVRGRGHYEVGGRRHPLFVGTTLVVPPGSDHLLEERSEDFEMWIAALRQPLVERACEGAHGQAFLGAAARGDCARQLTPDDARWIAREMRRVAEARSQAFLHAGLVYVVAATLESFFRAMSSSPEATLSPAVRGARALLDDEPSLARDELAERLGTAPGALGRAFRRELGATLVEYRNRVRVQRFLDLMAEGGRTILAACLDAGFGSYPQFHRVFVDETGQTPAAFVARGRGARVGPKSL